MMFAGACIEYGEPVAWLWLVGVMVKTRSLPVFRLIGVEMVRVVPEALLDIIRGEKSGIRRDGSASVEVEDL